jgi:hypothetical protein
MGEECSEVKRDSRTNPPLAHDYACRYVVLGTLKLVIVQMRLFCYYSKEARG